MFHKVEKCDRAGKVNGNMRSYINNSYSNLKNCDCTLKGLAKCLMISISVVSFFFIGSVLAEANNNSNLDNEYATKNLISKLTPIIAFYARFEQVTIIQGKNKKPINRHSSGVMKAQKPSFFIWETQRPFPQMLITDGKKLWLYDKDLEQVTIEKYDEINYATPAILFGGKVDDAIKMFDIKSVGGTGSAKVGNVRFLLTPKSNNNLFDKLELAFNDDVLTEMLLVDALGTLTEIKFYDVKNSSKNIFKQSEFLFVPPSGVDVLDKS